MNTITDKQSFCVASATKVLGDKWSPKLISTLLDKPLHFCEIQSATVGINPRILSMRLNKLVKLGVVDKTIPVGSPHKTIYSLTKMGKDLFPILNSMVAWGKKYGPKTD